MVLFLVYLRSVFGMRRGLQGQDCKMVQTFEKIVSTNCSIDIGTWKPEICKEAYLKFSKSINRERNTQCRVSKLFAVSYRSWQQLMKDSCDFNAQASQEAVWCCKDISWPTWPTPSPGSSSLSNDESLSKSTSKTDLCKQALTKKDCRIIFSTYYESERLFGFDEDYCDHNQFHDEFLGLYNKWLESEPVTSPKDKLQIASDSPVVNSTKIIVGTIFPRLDTSSSTGSSYLMRSYTTFVSLLHFLYSTANYYG
jgi:hypothetical protein